jgi:HSP20 family protein
LQSWDPFDAPGRILARFGGRFEGGWPNDALLQTADPQHLPPADVFEDAEGWHALIELPGVAPNDLAVTLLDDCLIVEADRPFPFRNSAKICEQESRYGTLRREFMLPVRSEPGRAIADLSSGVLHVLVPKSPASVSVSRSIETTHGPETGLLRCPADGLPFGIHDARYRGDP